MSDYVRALLASVAAFERMRRLGGPLSPTPTNGVICGMLLERYAPAPDAIDYAISDARAVLATLEQVKRLDEEKARATAAE